jgi:hypothetical protein
MPSQAQSVTGNDGSRNRLENILPIFVSAFKNPEKKYGQPHAIYRIMMIRIPVPE